MTYLEQVAPSTERPNVTRRGGATSCDTTARRMLNNDAGVLAKNHRSILLNRMVEAEILPRLALARAGAADRPAEPRPSPSTTEDDTTELVRLLMHQPDGSAWSFIELLAQRGATPTSLYLGIVTQAARRLGELWEEDRCDFAQVTISLGRLQQVVRALSPTFQAAALPKSAHANTILLLPAPGEQHTLGLVILAEFFQREGWHIAGGPVSTGYDATELLRTNCVDIVGFSIGSVNRLEGLAACIRSVRNASRNRYLGVMVGGPLFLQHPELVTRVGADTTAADAPGAVRQARGLLAMRAAFN